MIAFLAAITAGCNDIKESAESVSFPEKEIVLTATREGLAPGTRSFRLDDGSVWWSPNEEVSVFYGSGSGGGSKFVSMNTSIAETVELQGSIQMTGSGKAFWAVYPYSEDNYCDGSSITTVIPSSQTGVEGNFSDNSFPAMAKGNSTSLPFWNICGGIKFFVSRTDIKSVSIKGNNNEILAGKVKVAFSQDGKPEVVEVIDGKTEVSLNAPDGAFKVGKYYYITLLPASINGGFTMTFMTESEIGSFESKNKQTVKRSTFGVLKNIDAKVTEWESNVVEPEAVDLGLSVKWATFNVGATKPEEYGDYFAWGETEPKSNYNWSTYKFRDSGDSWENVTFNKYCTRSSRWDGSEPMDDKTVLDPVDDAAQVNWGGRWRIPTKTECDELINNCTWTWTSNYNGTGVAGRVVTSKRSGYADNSIFLPAAGWRGNAIFEIGSTGFYWSSSLYTDVPCTAWYVDFVSGGVGRLNLDRLFGFSIRPVYGEFIPVTSVTLNESSRNLVIGSSAQLVATITPSNATEPSVRWVSADESIATVDDNGLVTAISAGATTITAYASNGTSASCEVIVTQVAVEYEYVDLGLSVKWATMNVGATKPEEYGDYFAWGETEPYYEIGYARADNPAWKSGKESGYDWPSYKYGNGEQMLVKYCPKNKSGYWEGQGEPDGLTKLEPNDDAAHVNWGGNWRMPTISEWSELKEYCTWTWTDNYKGTGIAGRIITRDKTGYEGISIFLPAAGERRYTTSYDLSVSWGNYWSSSLYVYGPNNAWHVYFSKNDVSYDAYTAGYRTYGKLIRPVCPK